jgi:hypothetical protein
MDVLTRRIGKGTMLLGDKLMHAPTHLALVATFALAGTAWAAAGAASVESVLDRITAAHQQNYDSLERAPIRHWGELNQLRPLNDLLHTLRNRPASTTARSLTSESAMEQFDAIYAAFAEQLRLTPAGELRVGTTDGITATPQTLACTAFVDVPTALVLRVKAADRTEKINVSPVNDAGVEIAGQTLTPAGPLTLYAVLPLIATGEPGRRELALRVFSGGRGATIPLVIDVQRSGRLTGTVCEAEDEVQTPLVVKLFVEDTAGRLYVAPGAPNYTTQNWYGTWLPRFTYADGPCWFAARCFGESDVRYPHQTAPNQFAHTNLLMVTVEGKRPASAAHAGQFVQEIDGLIEFAPNIPSNSMRQRALKLYNEARQYYAAQTGERMRIAP